MGIIATLTKRHLKENKDRTVITIIGIVISAAMITAVFVTTASFFDYFGRLGIISDGNGEATFYPLTWEKVERLQGDDRIAAVGLIDIDESESGYSLCEGTTMRAKRGAIYTADPVNLRQMVSCSYEGRLPENGNEIAVEKSILEANHLDVSVGDTLTMEVGKRTWINGKGEVESYFGSYQSSETFLPCGTETFTITAVLHGNRATMPRKILRGASGEELKKLPAGSIGAMISLKNVNAGSYKEIMKMKDEYAAEHYRLNTEVLDSKFSLREGSSFVEILPLLSFVMICIIAFSVILIYNAFGMSLAERVRYLGMLASVGATRVQKRLSVYYEGLILGIAGIPVGVLAGIAGIAETLRVIGTKLVTSDIFPGIANVPGMSEITLVFPVWLIPCIVVVSFLTIFIAAFVPAHKASKIKPIDAVRQTNEISAKNTGLRTPGFVRKIFGYEGELAYKNQKRNGRKGRVIIFSISASIVMFLSMNYFCKLFWESNSDVYNLPFSVFATVAYDEKDRFEGELENVGNIKDTFGIDMFAYEYRRGDGNSPNMEIMDPEHFTKAYQRPFRSEMTLMLHLISDEDFRALCERQGLDAGRYFGDETNAVLCNNVSYSMNAKKVFTESMIGQKLFYDDRQANNPAVVNITDFVEWEDDPHIFGMYSKNTVTALMPYSNYVKTVYGGHAPKDLCYSVGIVTDEHESVLAEIEYILEEGGFHETYCEDIVSSQGTLSTLLYVLEIFTYGFLTLITLITVMNILNTISTGVMQRRKEFAMLRSVGMTPEGFKKMIRLESGFYSVKSVFWGLLISIAVSVLMNKLLPVSSWIPPDWFLYLATVLAVFAIIRLIMAYSVSKQKNDTIVEILKKEIN